MPLKWTPPSPRAQGSRPRFVRASSIPGSSLSYLHNYMPTDNALTLNRATSHAQCTPMAPRITPVSAPWWIRRLHRPTVHHMTYCEIQSFREKHTHFFKDFFRKWDRLCHLHSFPYQLLMLLGLPFTATQYCFGKVFPVWNFPACYFIHANCPNGDGNQSSLGDSDIIT